MTAGGLAPTLAAGVALGAVYALVGTSVAAVALATRTLHLAVGQILVAGTLARLYFEAAGLRPVAAIAGGLAVGAGVSALLEPAVLARLRPGLRWLVGLVVAAALLEAATIRWLSARTFRPRPLIGGEGTTFVAGLALPEPSVVAAAVGLPLAVALAAALRWTDWGRRLRLVGGSVDAAARAGVSARATRTGAFAVSGAVAVLAGLLVAPVTFVGAGQGVGFTVRGVAAATVFGVGSPGRALPAGLLLGLVEAAAQSAWPQAGGEVAVGAVVVALVAWRGGELARAWGRPW